MDRTEGERIWWGKNWHSGHVAEVRSPAATTPVVVECGEVSVDRVAKDDDEAEVGLGFPKELGDGDALRVVPGRVMAP